MRHGKLLPLLLGNEFWAVVLPGILPVITAVIITAVNYRRSHNQRGGALTECWIGAIGGDAFSPGGGRHGPAECLRYGGLPLEHWHAQLQSTSV